MERSCPWASHYKFANMLKFGSLIALPAGVLHRKTLNDKCKPVRFRTSFRRRLHCEYITSSPQTWGTSQKQELVDCGRHCSFLEHYPPRCPVTSPRALSYCCVCLTDDGCPFARVLCVASSSKIGKLVDAVVLVSRNEMVLQGSRFKAVMSRPDVDGRSDLCADFPLLTYFENMDEILGYIEIKVPERLTIITKGGTIPFQYERIFRIVAGGRTMFVIMVRFTDLNILDMRIYERRGKNWMRGDFTRAYVKASEVLFALRRALLGAGGDIQGFSFSITEFEGYCYDNQTQERQGGNRMLGDFTAPYLQAADVLVTLRRAVVMAGGDVLGFSISITGFEGADVAPRLTVCSIAPVEPESQVTFSTSCLGGVAKEWVLAVVAEANAVGFEDIDDWVKTLDLKQFLQRIKERFLDKTTTDKAFDELTTNGQKRWTSVDALSREVDRLLQVPGLNLPDNRVLDIYSRALPEPIRGLLVAEEPSYLTEMFGSPVYNGRS
ncbi:hypothetical protein CBR_g19007 [Chara braunii]|uniref:Uncharacterized protein n=1 Tax=Chara braunii TaxID=69332 RepID=A0A388KX20_CHABU|nr:hypothetical protein CBR_g19007 [Chara braunii]|eukprot:GBG74599.1 hypothetical protein CBR_g19007 [Chara braunii]